MLGYVADCAVLELGPEFYDPVKPANFPETKLRYRNDEAASDVGLSHLSHADWISHFGRFKPLKLSLIHI